jgi:hypothetical protein
MVENVGTSSVLVIAIIVSVQIITPSKASTHFITLYLTAAFANKCNINQNNNNAGIENRIEAVIVNVNMNETSSSVPPLNTTLGLKK